MNGDQVEAGAWHHERMMQMRSGPEPSRSSSPGRDFPRHGTPGGNSPGGMVALVGVIALAATLAPIAIAAGMSGSKGDGAKVVETVRTVTLGGDDAAFEATFDVRDAAPDCDREISLTIGAQQFRCGEVIIETRSSENVEDLERFGVRAIRAALLSDVPAPAMRPAETPHAPGMIAWSGSAVAGFDGVPRAVIVLGDGGHGADSGTNALVAIVSAAPGASSGAAPTDAATAVTVDEAAATILADVREGGAR